MLEKIGGELEGDQNVILSAREDWRGAGQEGDQNFILSEGELVRKLAVLTHQRGATVGMPGQIVPAPTHKSVKSSGDGRRIPPEGKMAHTLRNFRT